jgi:type 1 glutamine amidotransferase
LISQIVAQWLHEGNFDVEISNSLDVFLDQEKLRQVDLIVPNWTMGTISKDQLESLLSAVRNGTGLAGIHGGMGDAFRCEIKYQHMVGGQFVEHPGGEVSYTVHIDAPHHPVTKGIKDFKVTTEKYYMLIDPAIEALASTMFGRIRMPVVWIKKYGEGRIFYSSLGHSVEVVLLPQVMTITRKGMLWAAR